MDIDKEEVSKTLDLLRLKLIQQRTLTEEITILYSRLNTQCGTLIDVPVEQKTKAKVGWGSDPNYKAPQVSPETMTLRDHVLSKDF